MRSVLRLFLICFGLLLARPGGAVVLPNNMPATLINAINAANATIGDDVIDLNGFTFSLTGVNNTTDGANGLPSIVSTATGGNLTIQNGTIQRNSSTAFRIFHTAVGSSLTLDNVTLNNGLARNRPSISRGGAIFNQGALLIQNSFLTNNTADGSGLITLLPLPSIIAPNHALGGSLYHANGTLNIENTSFTGNEANGGDALVGILNFGATRGRGGAIYSEAPVGDITNSTFNGNEAHGGSVLVATLALASEEGRGGAIYLGSGVLVNSITETEFSQNIAQGGAGAIGVVTNSASDGLGGAIYSEDAQINTINTSVFSQNQALGAQSLVSALSGSNGYGGAIFQQGNIIFDISFSIFDNNQATGGNNLANVLNSGFGRGGAIFNNGGNLYVGYSTLSNNSALGGGSILSILNDDGSHGGAIYLNNASLSILNSTLSGNQAEGHGGAIDMFNGSGISSNSNTIAFNTAGQGSGGGGIFIHSSSTLDIISTIVAQNTDNDDSDGTDIFEEAPLGTQVINTAEYNLIGTAGGHTIVNGVNNNIVGADPLLGPLADNGGVDADGQAIFTHALTANSPAIDTGFNSLSLTEDQRGPGFPREIPSGDPLNTDIGAFELECVDTDLDGVCNSTDNCPLVPNPGQENPDGDPTYGQACDPCPGDNTNTCELPDDPDDDDDGFLDINDNCPHAYNPDQTDSDGDLIGNVCDPCHLDSDIAPGGSDFDNDNVCNINDNCPLAGAENYNPLQEDTDQDGIGDVCDPCTDQDGDGFCDGIDNCIFTFNPNQADSDVDINGDPAPDGIGDACDQCPSDDVNSCDPGDIDGDGHQNDADNCPGQANPDQGDSDGDGMGNPCDPCPNEAGNACNPSDVDGDGILNQNDNCIAVANPGNPQPNADGDIFGDLCDPCPNDNTNTCATDTDGDGVPNVSDNCIAVPNPDTNPDPNVVSQPNADNDAFGDLCDPCPNDNTNTCATDTDGDGVPNVSDNCIAVDNPDTNPDPNVVSQPNADGDAFGDACDICPYDATNTCLAALDNDLDDDGDLNSQDNCISVPNANQANADNDAFGDLCDPCPNDNTNTCATDTDGDGVPNVSDNCIAVDNPDTNPDPSVISQPNADGDAFGDPCDPCPNDATNSCATDTDGDGVPNVSDNCIAVPNPDTNPDPNVVSQPNADNDAFGDACDICPDDATNTCFSDPDGDGVTDNDNCPFDANPGQEDTDNDGIGNACDVCPRDPAGNDDADNDLICDAADRCVGSDDALDTDNDGIPDGCDNCLEDANQNQRDSDLDGTGDVCDDCTDTDDDGVGDPGFDNSGCEFPGIDNCPYIANSNQEDFDHDNIGDRCDTIPGGATVIPGEPLPPPVPLPVPIAPVGPIGPGIGGVGPGVGPAVGGIGVPPVAVNKAPNPEIVVRGKRPPVIEEKIIEEEMPVDEEKIGGCSSTNSNASSLAMLLAMLLLLRVRPVRKNS